MNAIEDILHGQVVHPFRIEYAKSRHHSGRSPLDDDFPLGQLGQVDSGLPALVGLPDPDGVGT